MKIYIGADHNGFHLKSQLVSLLKKAGYAVVDEGDSELDPLDDFPVFASRVATAVLASDNTSARGILLCGSGQGMAIAANRHKGIRAVICWEPEQARLARHDDDANILALPAYVLGDSAEDAMKIIDTFLRTNFNGGAKYVRRIKELDKL